MGWITDLLKEVPLSAILREKLTDLEKEHSRVTAENTVLKAENTDLQAKLQDAQNEANQVKRSANKMDMSGHVYLSERSAVETKILLFLAEKGETMTEIIAKSVGVGIEVARFHLHELERDDFIFSTSTYGVESWQLNHEGRRYLVQRGLIK